MPPAEPEMVLINKFYDFAVWTGKHVGKFPRTYKFTVGDRLQNRVNDILELLIKAKYRRKRLELLQDANLALELLRFQFRMARDLRLAKPNVFWDHTLPEGSTQPFSVRGLIVWCVAGRGITGREVTEASG